ncbi:hypothetical protein GCM10023156_30390 [Novipirellula rosea]|uniref:Uncharacterized protein n=1 Tax=Novipirellula rosea TaxID=1031540 RepID=A0ABP8MTI4_9BACT
MNEKLNAPARTLVFEANFPMSDHICNGDRYRLESVVDTRREIGNRTVHKYVFVLDENEEDSTPTKG